VGDCLIRIGVLLAAVGLWAAPPAAAQDDGGDPARGYDAGEATPDHAGAGDDAEDPGAAAEGGPEATEVEREETTERERAIEEARLLFLAGQEAFEQSRYEGALDYFLRAHELTGDDELLYNIGVTADRLRRDADALDAFERYVEANPRTPDRAQIEARIRVLREQIARDRVTTPGTAERTGPLREGERRDTHDGSVDGGGAGLLGQWWFWGLVGVAVAGGVTAAIVVGGQEAEPAAGDEGVVLYGLGVAP